MRLKYEQFAQHLKQSLAPVYLIGGEEILLVNELVDALRSRARAQGYEERLVFTIERGFDWGVVTEALQSMSLFSAQRWIELRIPEGKPGDVGGKIIEQYIGAPARDILLVIVSGKLDKATQNTKWYKAVEHTGVSVVCYPVGAQELPSWVTTRMRARGLQATPGAAKLLAERVEGNLLAAAQEIEKLALTHQGNVDEKIIVDTVADSARFDVFDLADALVMGDGPRALRMLNGLRETGVEPTLVLWACVRELRILARLATVPAPSRDTILQELHVWQNRWALYRKACARLSAEKWTRLLLLAQRVDRSIKGLSADKPWDGLAVLATRITGVSLRLDNHSA